MKEKRNSSIRSKTVWKEDEIRNMLEIDEFFKMLNRGLMIDRHFTDEENELYQKWKIISVID